MEQVNDFISIINKYVDYADKTYIKRHNKNIDKLNFKNILFASLKDLNDSSLDEARGDLEGDAVNVSKNAIIKKRNNSTTYEHIKILNDSILEEIYDKSNNLLLPTNLSLRSDGKSFFRNKNGKIDLSLYVNRSNKRFVAFDGSYVNVDLKLVNDLDVKLSKSKQYGSMLIAISYDVINTIPINYYPIPSEDNKKKSSETRGLIDQLHLFTSNDILIFDRLYFSDEVFEYLIEHDIGFIFRMKNNSHLFTSMRLGQSKIIEYKGVFVQLFKYKIKDEIYCVLTSITEKISIAEIKALYWLRWNVEKHIRVMKYDILFDMIRSKKHNTLMTDLECIRFIGIVAGYIEQIGMRSISHTKKINTKNCLHVIFEKLLSCFFYSPLTSKQSIMKYLGIIWKTIVYIVQNRSYKRIRVTLVFIENFSFQ
jgi:hypothetical protein